MIPQKPKKERRFLKMLGRVGEVLVQEALIKVIKGVIARIGSKKNLPTILFCLLSVLMFAQYPSTGNKQRLGYQTTGDGLVWRGSLSDTASIQPTGINNAWVIIDTVNLKFYSFDFTSKGILSPEQILSRSLIIYVFYLLMTKQNYIDLCYLSSPKLFNYFD